MSQRVKDHKLCPECGCDHCIYRGSTTTLMDYTGVDLNSHLSEYECPMCGAVYRVQTNRERDDFGQIHCNSKKGYSFIPINPTNTNADSVLEKKVTTHIFAMSSAVVQAGIICKKIVRYGKMNKEVDSRLANEAKSIIQLVKDIVDGKYRDI